MPCLFCAIASGDEPAEIVFQDELCVAFLDYRPLFPGHVLLIPRRHAVEDASAVAAARGYHGPLLLIHGAQDHGVPVVRLKEMFQAVAANARTFDTIAYSDQGEALRDLREGRIGGLVTIPPDFSRQLLAGASPRIALIEDNTDQFSAASLEGALTQLLASYNQKAPTPRLAGRHVCGAMPVTSSSLRC